MRRGNVPPFQRARKLSQRAPAGAAVEEISFFTPVGPPPGGHESMHNEGGSGFDQKVVSEKCGRLLGRGRLLKGGRTFLKPLFDQNLIPPRYACSHGPLGGGPPG